ncbi:MAG: ABC transporter substrate-binding protein [Desulfocapsaceae bacterium]|nr:ABC transporter substrate-binding protein [Desulfocapsaceae bacterium]
MSSPLFLWILVFCTLIAVPQPVSAYRLIDQDGAVHLFDRPFTRIISLYPGHTENIAEMGGQDSLIGISSSDTFPETLLHKPRFSYHDSVEKFISAQPDCILIRPMIRHTAQNLVEKLQEYGITVISLQPTSVEELYTYWDHLGMICGKAVNAKTMTQTFKNRLETFAGKLSTIPEEHRPFVYFEAIHARMKTFSPSSIAMFCLEAAGGRNIAVDAVPRRNTNIAAYSKERILSHARSIDFFLAQSGRMNSISVEEIINEPGFGAIKAIRERRVYLIDEHLVSRPTIRLLDAITYIHELLYSTYQP